MRRVDCLLALMHDLGVVLRDQATLRARRVRKGHGAVLTKARFWQHWADLSLNELQVKRINPLLDGFDGTWTVSKWAAIAKCSQDTALRDITEWLVLGVLQKPKVGGRSTRSPWVPPP